MLLIFGLCDELTLESLPSTVSLPVSEIYEDVEWEKDWTVCEDVGENEETAEAESYDTECAEDEEALWRNYAILRQF